MTYKITNYILTQSIIYSKNIFKVILKKKV